jgi:hypothetical protein
MPCHHICAPAGPSADGERVSAVKQKINSDKWSPSADGFGERVGTRQPTGN